MGLDSHAGLVVTANVTVPGEGAGERVRSVLVGRAIPVVLRDRLEGSEYYGWCPEENGAILYTPCNIIHPSIHPNTPSPSLTHTPEGRAFSGMGILRRL